MSRRVVVSAAQHSARIAEGWYVYGLLDPQALQDTGNRLLSIFYVGKGRQDRWRQHEKDERRALEQEREQLERQLSKAQRIRKILERGDRVGALLLSAGYVDEDDAYRAESMAIDTIGALLAAAGRAPLTNAIPGRHAGFLLLGEHFRFTETTETFVEAAAPDVDHAATTDLLVKGTAEEMVAAGQRVAERGLAPALVAGLGDRIVVLDSHAGEGDEDRVRRGWDPLDPWTDEEARERARRYWPLSPDRVARWCTDPGTAPRSLLLGIPAADKRTVVRYAGEIDPRGRWEFYLGGRWGIPLGRRQLEHPRLGAALYEEREGRRVRVLLNVASGIREVPGAG